ncbi:hypothetical protein MCGE09_00454, partial [Thaumarchaeota archaeon SCGC AB-539-E09]
AGELSKGDAARVADGRVSDSDRDTYYFIICVCRHARRESAKNSNPTVYGSYC